MNNIISKLARVPKKNDIALELDGIVKTFLSGGEPLTILKGCHLQLRRGEIVALVGPSGCGKSTLLQCAGLLERPTRGQILIQGAPVQKLSDDARAKLRLKTMGFVYQKHYLLDDFTALENVMFPMMADGIQSGEASEEAMKLLKMVGVQHRAEHRPMEMSGGEQQRVAVARALANRPQILLADEPTGNLDPVHAEAVFKMILALVKKTGLSMLMVTHDMNLAKRADRVVRIENGLVV